MLVHLQVKRGFLVHIIQFTPMSLHLTKKGLGFLKTAGRGSMMHLEILPLSGNRERSIENIFMSLHLTKKGLGFLKKVGNGSMMHLEILPLFGNRERSIENIRMSLLLAKKASGDLKKVGRGSTIHKETFRLPSPIIFLRRHWNLSLMPLKNIFKRLSLIKILIKIHVLQIRSRLLSNP